MNDSIWVDLLGARVGYRGKHYRTRVIEAGEGPAFILIHGLGGHAEAWSRNVMRLSRDFHVFAIDLLWHGLSEKPPVPDSLIPVWASQILDVMDSAGIERAHLEGESLGGWITLWMALNHPDRVDKMIVNTTAGVVFANEAVQEHPETGIQLLRERSLEAVRHPTPAAIRRRLEWLMAKPDRVTEELVAVRHYFYTQAEAPATLERVFTQSLAIADNPHHIAADHLRAVSVPTLVLWTDHNPGNGPGFGRKIAAAIPQAQFACMADAAHWPQWEQPMVHDQIVRDFLLASSRS